MTPGPGATRYALTGDPLTWVQQSKLVADDLVPDTSFGGAVAISGDTAVVGAYFASPGGTTRAGAAYVLVRSGTSWTQQAVLTASDKAANSYAGVSVAISGDTIIVGAYGATGPSHLSYSGEAYIFVRTGTTWTEQARLSASDPVASGSFGTSVALSGDSAVIGSPQANPSGKIVTGAVYVFTRSGGTWTQQAELVADDKEEFNLFGDAVALDGDTVVVGADYSERLTGSAYVFVGSGGTWKQQAKLFAPRTERAIDDHFGRAVGIAGDTILIGDLRAGAGTMVRGGAVHVFLRSGTTWTQDVELTASDRTEGDWFGSSVVLAGDTAAIGAPHAASLAGAAYVFTRNGTTWTQQQELAASDATANSYFASSVAISADTLALGAPGTSSAYIFIGLKKNGDSCAADAECLSKTCAAGTCGKTNGTACAATADCKSAFCVDGMCCNNACAGGTADCQACSKAAGAPADGTCGLRAATAVCSGAVASTCVASGTCDGASTACKLVPAAQTVICSTSADSATCRANYRCDGVTAGSCPTTNPTPASNTTVCNPSSDASKCIASYRCDGMKAGTCPATNPTPASSITVCNASGDASKCAATFRCDGAKAGTCPTTNPTPASSATVCNASGDATRCAATFRCDGATAGSCPVTNLTPASSATVCNAAGDPTRCIGAFRCDGVNGGSCPTTSPTPAAAGVMCRAASSECGAVGQCNGSMTSCPADHPGADHIGCSAGTCQAGQCRAEAELSLQFSAPAATSRQEPVSVPIQVKNTGKSTAANVTLKLTLPAAEGFAVSQVTGAGWSCQTMSAAIICTIGQIVPGDAPDLTLVVVPPLNQDKFTIAGQLTSATFDADLTNNSAQLSISNSAPCAAACPSDSGVASGGSGGGAQVTGCQLGGHAATPSGGWLALLGAGFILRRRSSRRAGRIGTCV